MCNVELMPPDNDTTQHIWHIVPQWNMEGRRHSPASEGQDADWKCKRCGWQLRSKEEPDSRKKYVLMEMAESGKLTLSGALMDCGEYMAYRIMTS